jgi:hypothetical protein
MSRNNKWLTRKEAWNLAQKIAEKLGNIQAVAAKIACSPATIYRWGQFPKGTADVWITEALRDLAIKEGIIKP